MESISKSKALYERWYSEGAEARKMLVDGRYAEAEVAYQRLLQEMEREGRVDRRPLWKAFVGLLVARAFQSNVSMLTQMSRAEEWAHDSLDGLEKDGQLERADHSAYYKTMAYMLAISEGDVSKIDDCMRKLWSKVGDAQVISNWKALLQVRAGNMPIPESWLVSFNRRAAAWGYEIPEHGHFELILPADWIYCDDVVIPDILRRDAVEAEGVEVINGDVVRWELRGE